MTMIAANTNSSSDGERLQKGLMFAQQSVGPQHTYSDSTMATSTSNIAFVLVPGSFSPASYYDKLVPLLEARGHRAHPTELKSANDGEGAVVSMYEDADAIRETIEKLADQGKSVVLAMNSYGGLPGTQAARGLSKAERQAAGKPGALVGLVYLSSFMLGEGDYINRVMAGRMPDNTQTSTDYLAMNPRTDAEYIFAHVGPDEKAEYASRLRKHSSRTFQDPLTYAGYLKVPATYLVCTDDPVIPPELQRELVDQARGKGAVVVTKEVHSDHVPMISHPEEVAEVLLEAAERGLQN
ncbi:hypothetical protein H2204_003434 [Knufia peltigerae]|uniref:AB hydrolase-1 domain-containing protein n=1 Tax=Knufia peltigerae TaxID=1002370 RepID=A0AA38Y9C4_9EURO|nr:hypothetical protein H2204_003434 [Knufia peltigerae]